MGSRVNLVKFGSRASAVIVAAVAGYSSWQHIVEVARDAGEDLSVAGVMPLSIDGLVVVASLAMIEDKRNGQIPRWSARVALVFGILATLGFNLASAEPTWTARAVAAVPAISFLLAVEVLSRTGKGARSVSTPVQVGIPTPTKGVGTADTPGNPLVTTLPSGDASLPPLWKVSGQQSNADKVRLTAARLPADATLAEIAAEAGVSESTARRYLKGRKPTGPDPVPVGAST
jgi:hypothetical protein